MGTPEREHVGLVEPQQGCAGLGDPTAKGYQTRGDSQSLLDTESTRMPFGVVHRFRLQQRIGDERQAPFDRVAGGQSTGRLSGRVRTRSLQCGAATGSVMPDSLSPLTPTQTPRPTSAPAQRTPFGLPLPTAAGNPASPPLRGSRWPKTTPR